MGRASLGVLIPRQPPRLTLGTKPDGRAVVRLALADAGTTFDLSVTDLRLYTDDGARPAAETIRDVADRLARGVPVLLSVGLTRPFSARPDEPPLHWLQVNNIHLEDDPTWRLTPTGPTHAAPMAVGAGPDELPF